MEVSIRPLVAPGAPAGTIRVWVAVLGHGADPALTWSVDDAPPATPPGPVRTLALADPGNPQLRILTGVFDLPGLPSGPGFHRIGVTATSGDLAPVTASVETRALPDEVPADRPFTVLLVSCFYRNRDKSGRAGALVSQLTGTDRPDLVLTVGDQVYLDQPPLTFSFDEQRLAATFAQKYRDNFVGTTGYAAVLRSGPVAAIPDDHEYWNNYPHVSPLTLQSVLRGDLETNPWRLAARAMYDAFQLGRPGEYTYRVDVPPLSFFLMDNRTFRVPDGSRTMRDSDRDLYTAWIADVLERGLVPVIATGPSLFQPPKHGFARFTDRNLANYPDYRFIMDGLLTLAREGRHVLAVTGDVHYGRVVDAALFGTTPGAGTSFGWIREVISSPSALVWGSKWTAPGAPPQRFAPGSTPTKLDTVTVWPEAGDDVRGDHVALLRFTRAGSGVRLDVEYRMVHEVAGHRLSRYPVPPITFPTTLPAGAVPAADRPGG